MCVCVFVMHTILSIYSKYIEAYLYKYGKIVISKHNTKIIKNAELAFVRILKISSRIVTGFNFTGLLSWEEDFLHDEQTLRSYLVCVPCLRMKSLI